MAQLHFNLGNDDIRVKREAQTSANSELLTLSPATILSSTTMEVKWGKPAGAAIMVLGTWRKKLASML